VPPVTISHRMSDSESSSFKTSSTSEM